MRSNLNSILIEGLLTDKPTLDKATTTCTFPLRSVRVADGRTENTDLIVSTRSRLAEACAEYLEAGRGVRVVGRVAQATVPGGGPIPGTLLLVAEHVEFKPVTKPEPEPASESSPEDDCG